MQRYFAKEKEKNKFILLDSDIHHIKKVMRMKNKDQIEVLLDKKLYLCEINNIETDIEIKIVKEIKTNQNKFPKVTLIIPLLKEQKMDLILQKSTELGVDEIIPIITERSVVKIDAKKEAKKLERWTRICKEASEQSHRIDIPKISNIRKILELKDIKGVKFVCSTTQKTKNLKKLLKTNPSCDRINIAIGPEGGFSIKEEKEFNELGFESITLGNRIMRVETVPMFVLSVINYEFME